MSSDDQSDSYDLEMVTEKHDTVVPPEFSAPVGKAPPNPPPVRVAEVGLGEQVKAHFGRVMGDDALERLLADEERWFEVAAPEVADETFKRFLLLRRSALFVAALLLGVAALCLLINTALNMGQLPGSVVAGMFVAVAAVAMMAFVAFKAANDWALWRRQKKNLSITLLSLSGAALVSALVAPRGGVGLIAYSLVLLPLLTCAGPAATRAAIDVKHLFPGSAAGGWLLTVAAPVQSALVVASFTLMYVMGGGVLSLLVLLALMFAPLAALKVAPELRRPTTRQETSDIVDTPQLVMLAAYGVAALFAAVLVLSEGGEGVLAGVGLLAIVGGLYLVARICLLDIAVALLSEAAAVSDSEALEPARKAAKESWESFDREVTRDHERERAIYG